MLDGDGAITEFEDRSVTCHCCGEDVDEREARRFTDEAGYVCPGCVEQVRDVVAEAQREFEDFVSLYGHQVPAPRSRTLIRQLGCMIVQERAKR